MDTRNKLIKLIGEHVVSTFEQWDEKAKNGEPIGKSITIPVKIPREENVEKVFMYPRLGDVTLSVTIGLPNVYVRTGPDSWDYITLNEMYEMINE